MLWFELGDEFVPETRVKYIHLMNGHASFVIKADDGGDTMRFDSKLSMDEVRERLPFVVGTVKIPGRWRL